jgi:hypothetical protein
MTDVNTIKIALDAVQTGDLIKINLEASHLPKNFLGIAFHLKVEGADFTLEKYESGTATSALSQKPLMLASQKGDEIIFGLTKKAQDKTILGDGDLATFYIKTGNAAELNLKFSDTHLSVLSGGRKDLSDAVWEDEKVVLKEQESQQYTTQLQANVAVNSDQINIGSLIQLYEFILVVLIVMLVACVGYYLFVRWKGLDDRNFK